MTPKAQQPVSNYDVQTNLDQHQFDKKEANHQRSPSSTSNIIANINNTNSSASLLLNSLSNRVSNVISPSVIFLVATPIALRYPLIQLIMFLTILVGTSPLYFIMITFVGETNRHRTQHYKPNQPHRRQPSIVGSIKDMDNFGSESK